MPGALSNLKRNVYQGKHDRQSTDEVTDCADCVPIHIILSKPLIRLNITGKGTGLIIDAANTNSGYREYKSDPNICERCPMLMQCTRSANHVKVVTRHVWQDSKERIDAHRKTDAGKKIYARRKETVECSFADVKQLHGHRYARMRGLDKVNEQCLLAAACQNMKKIAQIKARKAFLLLLRRFIHLSGRIIRSVADPKPCHHQYRFAVNGGLWRVPDR